MRRALPVDPKPDANGEGSRYWRLKSRFGGKETVLALGVYPDVKLADARERRDDAKRELRDRIDPGAAKKARKLAERNASANTFRIVATEWLSKQRNAWDPKHAERVETSLKNNLYPDLGDRPIADIRRMRRGSACSPTVVPRDRAPPRRQ